MTDDEIDRAFDALADDDAYREWAVVFSETSAAADWEALVIEELRIQTALNS